VAERAGEPDDGLDDMAAGEVRSQVAHELDVDLQVVDGQVLQVAEAPEAGPEVVQRELAAQRCDARDERPFR
jgi:hypothetical protein